MNFVEKAETLIRHSVDCDVVRVDPRDSCICGAKELKKKVAKALEEAYSEGKNAGTKCSMNV